MPFKRNMRKRRPMRRRRPYRKKRYKRSIPRSLRADYSVKLNSLTFQIANNSTVPLKGAMNFSLSQCLGYTDYTKLFDQYRVNMVIVKFTPSLTTVVNRPFDDTTTPTDGTVPRLVTALDRDDSTIPIDFESVQSKSKSRITYATKYQSYKFRPNRLTMVYRTQATTGYKVDTQVKEFLDCGQADIPHYGVKYCLEPSSPSNTYVYDISVDYYVSFKNKR